MAAATLCTGAGAGSEADADADAVIVAAVQVCEYIFVGCARAGLALSALRFMSQFRDACSAAATVFASPLWRPTRLMHMCVVVAHTVAAEPLPALEYAMQLLSQPASRASDAEGDLLAPPASPPLADVVHYAVLRLMAACGLLPQVRMCIAALPLSSSQVEEVPLLMDTLVHAAGSACDLAKAENLVLLMLEQGVNLPVSSLNTLLRLYAAGGHLLAAFSLARAMFEALFALWDAHSADGSPGAWRATASGKRALQARTSWEHACALWMKNNAPALPGNEPVATSSPTRLASPTSAASRAPTGGSGGRNGTRRTTAQGRRQSMGARKAAALARGGVSGRTMLT
ncbi:hypothetical protein EON68_04430, partial [archaeon]